MPRVDNGMGRDISKWNGTLEKALIAHKDQLNTCKTNNDLIDVLMACEADGLSAEGTAYTDKLIAAISSNPNFRKNFQNVYNVLLKGTGNGVLKCSAKKPAKRGLKESTPADDAAIKFYNLDDVVEAGVDIEGISKYVGKSVYIPVADLEDYAAQLANLYQYPADDILDSYGARAYILSPENELGFAGVSPVTFWDYVASSYELTGECNLDDFGWSSVCTEAFDPVLNPDTVKSNSISAAKDIQEYIHLDDNPYGNVTTPDSFPETIKVGEHVVDLEFEDEAHEMIKDWYVDSTLVEWDEDAGDLETQIGYADTPNGEIAILVYWGRFSLLSAIAILNPSLTAVLKGKINKEDF